MAAVEAIGSEKSAAVSHSKAKADIHTETPKKKSSIFDGGVQGGAHMAALKSNSVFATA